MPYVAGTGIRIIKQPPNQVAYLEGMQGFIEEVKAADPKLGPMYLVRLLTQKGKSLGIGTVPESSLIMDDSPASKKSRQTYLENPTSA